MSTTRIAFVSALALFAGVLAAPAQAEDMAARNYCFIGARMVDNNGTLDRGWVCIEDRTAQHQQTAAVAPVADRPVQTAGIEVSVR